MSLAVLQRKEIFLLSAMMIAIEYIILAIKYLLAVFVLCVRGKCSDYPRL